MGYFPSIWKEYDDGNKPPIVVGTNPPPVVPGPGERTSYDLSALKATETRMSPHIPFHYFNDGPMVIDRFLMLTKLPT